MTQKRTLSLSSAALILVAGSLLAGCANTSDRFAPGTVGERIGRLLDVTGGPPVDYTLNERGQATLAVMTGELASQRGDHLRAAAEYMNAAKLTRQPELAREALRQSLVAGDGASALEAAKFWAELEPDEARAQQAAFRVALQQGADEEAVRQGIKMIESHPDGVGVGLEQATAIIGRDQVASAAGLRVAERLADHWPQEPEAAFMRSAALIEAKQYDAALAAADQALALRPNWPKAALLRSGVQIKQGNILSGVATMSPLLEDGESPNLRFALARMLLEARAYAPAQVQLERTLREAPDLADARFALALLTLDGARQVDDPETDSALAEAESQFQQLTADEDYRPDAYYYLGRIAETRQDYETALGRYERVTGGNHLQEALGRRALMIATGARGGTLEEARAFIQTIARQNPSLAGPLLALEADLLISMDEPAAAVDVYDEAIKRNPQDDDLRYGRSLALERAGETRAAEAELRALVKKNPDDARALNALGYLLANKGGNQREYKEAFALVRRALDLQPNDPAIMDSLGWAHFRLGRYQQAVEALERAYQLQDDAEIAAHLGEVYWVLGRQDDARALWQSALRESPEHDVLLETIERLAGPAASR